MSPVEATRRMYEHANCGDWDAVRQFMAEDFVIHEPETLPYGGEWRGTDALQRLYAEVMGFWDDPQVDWVDLVGGDTHVVALLRLTVTVPGTEKRVEHLVAEVTRFDPAGKMAEMRIHYFDTGALAGLLKG